MIRYIRIQSTVPYPVVDRRVDLDAVHVFYKGSLCKPVGGTVNTWDGTVNPDWTYLTTPADGRLLCSFGKGQAGQEYIELDLGVDKPVDKIMIYNRGDMPWNGRITNCTMRLFNNARMEVHRKAFSDLPTTLYTFIIDYKVGAIKTKTPAISRGLCPSSSDDRDQERGILNIPKST